jgi:hypothetical protein
MSTGFDDRAWSARARSPHGDPDAVALDTAATVDDVLSLVEGRPGRTVQRAG